MKVVLIREGTFLAEGMRSQKKQYQYILFLQFTLFFLYLWLLMHTVNLCSFMFEVSGEPSMWSVTKHI